MQPMLAIIASQPGIIYINGSFAGEVCADQALLRPVHPRGALYLDYRPMEDGFRPMARRLVFSGGRPLQESAEAAQGMSIVLWSGCVTEIELIPPLWESTRTAFSRGGFNFVMESSAEGKLLCEGRELCTLPRDAQEPQLRSLRDGLALLGGCRDGMYLLTADREMRAATGFLQAQEIEIDPEGQIRTLVAPGDIVGHGTQEIWQLASGGLTPVSSRGIWAHGAPRWPRTPEDTAIAAVEAALAGFDDEAEGYLSSRLRQMHPLDGIRNRCDLCVRIKYAPPGAQDCVGLLQLEGGNMARVTPLRFRTVPGDGRQGNYLLDELTTVYTEQSGGC